MGGPRPSCPLGGATFLARACRLFARAGDRLRGRGAGGRGGARAAGGRAPAGVDGRRQRRAGARACCPRSGAASTRPRPGADAVLLHPVDHPLVEPATIDAVLDALARGAAIAVPSHAGRRGHPAGFARAVWPDLRAAPPDGGRARSSRPARLVVHVARGPGLPRRHRHAPETWSAAPASRRRRAIIAGHASVDGPSSPGASPPCWSSWPRSASWRSPSPRDGSWARSGA